MGNGDVGVVAFTSDNSQTLKISKVDFVTDGWTDWAGSGPAALPIGGVNITVNSPVYSGFVTVNRADPSGFSYQMDQLNSELRMTTATAQQVKMVTWMGVNENMIITELTTSSKTPVPISVDTYADNQSASYTTTAQVNGQIAQVTRQTKTDAVRWISCAGISTKIVGVMSKPECLSESMVRSNFQLTASDTLLVVVYVSGGGKGNDPQLPTAYNKLLTLNKADVTQLKMAKKHGGKICGPVRMWKRMTSC